MSNYKIEYVGHHPFAIVEYDLVEKHKVVRIVGSFKPAVRDQDANNLLALFNDLID